MFSSLTMTHPSDVHFHDHVQMRLGASFGKRDASRRNICHPIQNLIRLLTSGNTMIYRKFRWLHIMIPNGHTAVMSLNDIMITDDNQTNKSMRVLPFVLRNSCLCVTNKVTQLSNHESPRCG